MTNFISLIDVRNIFNDEDCKYNITFTLIKGFGYGSYTTGSKYNLYFQEWRRRIFGSVDKHQ